VADGGTFELIEHTVVIDDDRINVPPVGEDTEAQSSPLRHPLFPKVETEPTVRAPLGTICGARSGDKGGNANVGLWVETPAAYSWLESHLTIERFRALMPEANGLEIDRHPLPNLFA
jgi:hypothetical protein